MALDTHDNAVVRGEGILSCNFILCKYSLYNTLSECKFTLEPGPAEKSLGHGKHEPQRPTFWIWTKLMPSDSRAKRHAPLQAPGSGVATPSPSALSATMRKVLGQFRIVMKSTRHHYQEVKRRTGVSGAEIWVLAQVADRPGIKVGELALALFVHPSTASNLVRKLNANGLLTRKRIPEDQRAVRLQLTQIGTTVLKRAPRPFIGVLQQALKDMPLNRLDDLHKALNHLLSSMSVKGTQAQSMPLSKN